MTQTALDSIFVAEVRLARSLLFSFQLTTYFVPVHPPSFSDSQFIPTRYDTIIKQASKFGVLTSTKATKFGRAYVWRAFISEPFTDTLCGYFRARTNSGFASTVAVDTPCCASSISGFCTAGNANTLSISSVGSVCTASTRSSTNTLNMPSMLRV